LWLNGPEGCAFVNRACRDFLGLNLQTDTRGFDWARYVHPEDREAYVAACRDAERRRAPFPGEFRFRRHDGEYRWMRSVFTPRVTTAGQFLGYIGCMLDIHEERAVAAALRDSETRLAAELADARLLQEVSVRLVAEGDVAALYDQIRDAAAALMQSDAASMQALDPATGDLRLLTWTGFAPESAAFWDRVRPDSGSTCGAALARGERVVVPDVEACDFMAGTQDLAEYRRSSLRAVQSTPLRTRDGRLLGMISTHWRRPREPSGRELRRLDVLARQAADLLERRLAEDALRQSERRLRLALSAARSGIWTLDLNTGAQTRGQNLNRLLGLESVETTQPFEEFLTHIQPDDRPRVREAFATSMREGSPLNIEFRVVLPGGEVRWLRDQGDVFGDAAAGARHMAGVCIDVTVLKEADARLRASEGRFRQILASATDFAIFTFDADRRVTGPDAGPPLGRGVHPGGPGRRRARAGGRAGPAAGAGGGRALARPRRRRAVLRLRGANPAGRRRLRQGAA
jgi:PAS domain S-box-containing protein